MEFAIISDVHDNLSNLNKVLNYCNNRKIKTLICCGDLASMETWEYLKSKFKGKIYFVFGNMDKDYFKNVAQKNNLEEENPNVKIFYKIGEFKIKNLRIAITHFPNIANDLAKTGKYNLVFFGHTHKPSLEKQNSTLLLNPGNTANLYYAPSFAVFDIKKNKPKLILLNEL